MAEKIKIEIYRKMDAEDFTKSLSDPDSRLQTGGGASMSGAMAASLLHRAAAITAETVKEHERLAYILRNSEILRGYMVQLIDEDVKSRGPLRRATKEGDAQKIAAAKETAVAICAEIVSMMEKLLEFLVELGAFCTPDARHYLAESAELAMGAVRASMHYILNMSEDSKDETYRYVTRRENELTMEQIRPLYEKVLADSGKFGA